MINLFLRFTDQAAWRDYATSAGILTQVEQPVLDEDGNETEELETVESWNYSGLNYAISDIGILYNEDGEYNDKGELVKAPTAKDGWHVNWKANEFPDGIIAFEVMPKDVKRVWSGDPVEFSARMSARSASAGEYGLPE